MIYKAILIFCLLTTVNTYACSKKGLINLKSIINVYSNDFEPKYKPKARKACSVVLKNLKCYRKIAINYLTEIEISEFELQKMICLQMKEMEKYNFTDY